jgi:hypothetical protein
MKSWIFCSLFFISLTATAQGVPFKESDATINTKQWTTGTVSEIAVINTGLHFITMDHPRSKMEEMVQRAFDQVQMFRAKLTYTGVITDGFAINVTLPPSIKFEFKFGDKHN